MRERGCRIGCEPMKMSRDPFRRSISRETNAEVSALFPFTVVKTSVTENVFNEILNAIFMFHES